MQRTWALFDHLVGAGENYRWHGEPERRLGGSQIEHEVEFGRLFALLDRGDQ